MKKLLIISTALVLLLGSTAFSVDIKKSMEKGGWSEDSFKTITLDDGTIMTKVIGPSYSGDVGTFAISGISTQGSIFYVINTTTGQVRFCQVQRWGGAEKLYQATPRCGPWSGDAHSWYE